MATFGVLLLFLSVIGLVIGLIKPTIYKFNNSLLNTNKSIMTRKKVIIGFGSMILVSLILIGISPSDQQSTTPQTTQQTTPSQPTTAQTPPQEQKQEQLGQREIDAKVNYSTTAFKIGNNEDKDWKTCKLELNSHGLSSGYVYRADSIAANDSLIVPFSEFTESDGTRFNVLSTKPQNLSIFCDDVGGQKGWNYFAI